MTLPSRLAALVVALLAVGCTHLAPVADDASPDTAPAVTADSAAIDAIPPAPDITPPGSDVHVEAKYRGLNERDCRSASRLRPPELRA